MGSRLRQSRIPKLLEELYGDEICAVSSDGSDDQPTLQAKDEIPDLPYSAFAPSGHLPNCPKHIAYVLRSTEGRSHCECGGISDTDSIASTRLSTELDELGNQYPVDCGIKLVGLSRTLEPMETREEIRHRGPLCPFMDQGAITLTDDQPVTPVSSDHHPSTPTSTISEETMKLGNEAALPMWSPGRIFERASFSSTGNSVENYPYSSDDVEGDCTIPFWPVQGSECGSSVILKDKSSGDSGRGQRQCSRKHCFTGKGQGNWLEKGFMRAENFGALGFCCHVRTRSAAWEGNNTTQRSLKRQKSNRIPESGGRKEAWGRKALDLMLVWEPADGGSHRCRVFRKFIQIFSPIKNIFCMNKQKGQAKRLKIVAGTKE
ncbi:hypothetical protein BSKO_08782 [Bryopsis sp. KO-2023]|nr:hypothetical protein BSKO_08782 [Bryopsis sp. KO-2023]